MTPLLSEQITRLPSAVLPQALSTQRSRLLRRVRRDPRTAALLEEWQRQLEAERNGQAPQDTKARKARELLAFSVADHLERLAERITLERPTLEQYAEVLTLLRSPTPYQPEPCAYIPFEQHDERNDPEYAELMKEARKRAEERGARTFVFRGHLVARLTLVTLIASGLGLVALGVAAPWFEAETGDTLALLGGNLVILAGLLSLRLKGLAARQLDVHIGELEQEERVGVRKEIERRERERLDAFLDGARARREQHDVIDQERRTEYEKQESERIALMKRLCNGNDPGPVLDALLPLDLPLPCATSHRVFSDGRVEVQLLFPMDMVLPPSVDGMARLERPVTTNGDRRLEATILPLSAALAIRHLGELFFHLPNLRTAHLVVSRALDLSGEQRVPMLQIQADRRAFSGPIEVGDPTDLLRAYRHRIFFSYLPRSVAPAAAAA